MMLPAILLAVAIPMQAAAVPPDLALQPARFVFEFDAEHAKSARGAQGVPAVERAPAGRLWAAWYAGKSTRGVESPHSYVVLATSGDDGVTWTEKLVLLAPRLCWTRYTLNREGKRGTGSVLLARFTEADVRAGRVVGSASRLKTVVSRLRDE